MEPADQFPRPDAVPLGPREWLILPKLGHGALFRSAFCDLGIKCAEVSQYSDGGEAFGVRGASAKQVVTVFAMLRDL